VSSSTTRRSLIAACAAGLAGSVPRRRAAASALPEPSTAVILTVSGAIAASNAPGGRARFDRPMLEALGTASFTTSTPWYDRPTTFEGVPMAALMDAVGARGETVVALALNDYRTDIPVGDFARYGVLLAMKRDGAYMPVRDKGPLFIVYPYDSSPELRNRRFYSRSAWQVASLEVR
jgi:hypothetical protein